MKNLTINKNYVIIVLSFVLLVVATSLFRSCESEKVALASWEASKKDVEKYKLKGGEVVSSKPIEVISKEQFEEYVAKKDKQINEMIKKFSKVTSATVASNTFTIEKIPFIFKDTIPCVFSKRDSIKTKEYSVGYFMNQKGLDILNLKVNDTIKIVEGYKRKWFLGKKTLMFDMTHTNKFVETDKIQTYEIKKGVPSRFGLGLHFGYDPFNGKPVGSVGLNYNLLQF